MAIAIGGARNSSLQLENPRLLDWYWAAEEEVSTLSCSFGVRVFKTKLFPQAVVTSDLQEVLGDELKGNNVSCVEDCSSSARFNGEEVAGSHRD
jgi:hypothetical protein